ncbi:hypothetical protein P4O66_003871 [Electrophorus voltai]|uniref:Neuregulin C-terminal domain-containing protein n=1 Tax=Electrophorus voltai TaxID=2609070 RepID=A0AAD8ZRP0_9TELE|nr:hypothetical protein P4O66_003871 [Electrophorus voltai]
MFLLLGCSTKIGGYVGNVSHSFVFSLCRSLALSSSRPFRGHLRSRGGTAEGGLKSPWHVAEELYQKRVLTITGICVALLVVGIVCVVAYCKTKKQSKKMQNHLHQNMCVEHPNRMLANGPNHPGPGPGQEEIPMVDYISKNVPATERIIRHGTETSGNFSGSRMSSRSHHSSTDSHASCHRCWNEERTWSMERSDSMNSDCHSGALSSSVGTSKCSSPACMARRAAHCGYSEPPRRPLQYGDSYDSLRDSPHSDRYVSALTTPARLSPVDFHSSLPQQVPTFQITTPNASHALSLPPAASSAAAVGCYSPGDDQPLLRRPRRTRRPCGLAESAGSLPASPYRFADDEDYETTQEYMSSRERPKKMGSDRRWRRRPRANGHVSQRARGPGDFSSQSCLSDSEWEQEDEDEELGDLAHGESTPFLSMQNMTAPEPLTICRPNDTRTYSGAPRGGSRLNPQGSKLSQDYPLLIEPPTVCANQSAMLLLAIKSQTKNFENRQAIRQTWGHSGLVQGRVGMGGLVQRVFLLAKSAVLEDSKEMMDLEKESKSYGDIIMWDFLDTFFNLTLKDILFWEWFSEHCQNARFVFKGDDDVFVRTPALLDYLQKEEEVHSAPNSRKKIKDFVVGDVIKRANPLRLKSSKYYIPESFYKGMYPAYAGGGGVIYSGALVLRLFQVSKRVHLFPIDDVYVGMCLQRLRIVPVDQSGFLTFDFSQEEAKNPCAYHTILLVHKRSPSEVLKL